MSTAEKCEAILRRLVEIANEKADEDPMGWVVGLGPDWGGNALTYFEGRMHTHVGSAGGTFEQLVDSFYDLLIDGRGLSLA